MTLSVISPLNVLHAIEIDPQTDPRWEAFAAQHPDGTIYHHPAWLKALELEYGRRTVNLACEDEAGNLCGILPLLPTRGLPLSRNPLWANRLSSLPRTPIAGPLASHPGALLSLLQAAVERVQAVPGLRLQLKLDTANLDGLLQELASVPWRLSYVLHLPSRPEEVRFGNSRSHGRIKWQVRAAVNSGLALRPAETERDLRSWYFLYLDTMRHHAVPPRPFRFFQSLWQHLRPRSLMELVLAEQHRPAGPKLIAGSMFLSFGQTVFYAFNGVRRQDLRLHPNDLIQWNAIHQACRKGFRKYDFGEVVNGHEGLADFKSKWGATPVRLYRYYYPPVGNSAHHEASHTLRKLAVSMWRAVPLQVTSLAGDFINRYL